MNCGTSGHDEECLCDVVVLTPTGWVSDAVQDMWMGVEIASLRNYNGDWTDETIISYLQDLVYAKDNWGRYSVIEQTHSGSSGPSALRVEISRRLQTMPTPSIRVVAEELRLGIDELLYVMFTNRRTMTMAELEEFESDVLGKNFSSPHGLAVKYGMPFRSARSLHAYWGVPFSDDRTSSNPAVALMDELLIAQPNLKTWQVAEIIERKLGVDARPSLAKIRNRKHYLKKCKRLISSN